MSESNYEQLSLLFSKKASDAIASYEAYWEDRTWQRFVRCDRLADPHDLPAVNTFKTWLSDHAAEIDLDDAEEWIRSMPAWRASAQERLLDICCEKETNRLNQVLDVLTDLRTMLENWWTVRVLRRTCRYPDANERILEHRTVSLYFWQDTVKEKRAKMLFYGGLELEIAPHMRNLNLTLRIVTEWKANADHIAAALSRYPPAEDLIDKPFEISERSSRRVSVSISDRLIFSRSSPGRQSISPGRKQSTLHSSLRDESPLPSKRRTSKDAAARRDSKASSKSKGTKKKRAQSNSPSKKKKSNSPKRYGINRKAGTKTTKRSSRDVTADMEQHEHLKASLLSKVTSLWTPAEPSTTVAPSHEIDDRIECILGHTYDIKTFVAPPFAIQSGEWTIYEERDVVTEAGFPGAGVAGQEFMNVGLKIPVEEIFVTSGDPMVAFYDERSGKWKKGIYTTHVEHDRRSSAMKFRLSKLGKIALFQKNDFHFPFKKWIIGPTSDGAAVTFSIETDMVSLEFRLEENCISLNVQSGAEFAKLKSMNKKALSLGDMAQHLIQHGVCMFPNDHIVQQHAKDNRKDFELEELVCRQMALCACKVTMGQSHLNSSLHSDSIVISSPAPEQKSDKNMNEWPLYRVTKTDGQFKTIAYTMSDSTVSATLDDATEEEQKEHRSLVHALMNISENGELLSMMNADKSALSSTVYRWLMLTRVLCMTK